jgi:hypothetical protein
VFGDIFLSSLSFVGFAITGTVLLTAGPLLSIIAAGHS